MHDRCMRELKHVVITNTNVLFWLSQLYTLNSVRNGQKFVITTSARLKIFFGAFFTRYEVFFSEYNSHYRTGVHTVGLEDLRSLPNVFGMTDNNTDFTSSSAICNLHPILTRTWNCEKREREKERPP